VILIAPRDCGTYAGLARSNRTRMPQPISFAELARAGRGDPDGFPGHCHRELFADFSGVRELPMALSAGD
jgi:hypothetical protein